MKICVLANSGPSSFILINWLLQNDYKDLDVIFEAGQAKTHHFIKQVKRHGWRRAVGQAAFMTAIYPLLRLESARRRSQVLRDFELDDKPPKLASGLQVASVNDKVVSERLRLVSPDVVLVHGTRIIREPTLSATSAPLINTHVGITPQYRGVHGGYWALWNRDLENFGVTIHLVDRGVDTGAVLAQRKITPSVHDNFASYPLLQQAVSLVLLGEILVALKQKRSLEVIRSSPGPGRQWFHPTALEYLKGRSRGVK